MLVLRRHEGQWLEVRHRSGEVLRVLVVRVGRGDVDLAFEDAPRHFAVERPGRVVRPVRSAPRVGEGS